MQAGRLNRRVVLQGNTNTQDSTGADQIAYADTATVWAAIEAVRGQEFYESQKLSTELTVRIRIRYRSDVTVRWRVKYTDPGGVRYLGIFAVIQPFENRRETVLMCRELPDGEDV